MCRILVVEDNSIFRSALKEMLQTGFPDFSISEALNGLEAIKQFEDLKPKIIFLDVKLPDMNGLHLAKHMRTCNSEVNIIMFTSYDIPEYKIAARECGANCYLLKDTVKPKEVIEVVETLITCNRDMQPWLATPLR
ncbi:MAG: response regulator transcription factor [Syntrophobacteraceae bacterium]